MRTNRFREAFRENANLAGLAGAVAVSAALLNPIPLLVGAAAEVAYLLFVPDSRWYEVRLSRRFDAEVVARRKQLKDRVLPTLRRDVQERFYHLEGVRSQITTQSQDEQKWFREVLRKLDYLLEKFLLFAGKEAQFRSYLQSLSQEVQGASATTPAYVHPANFSRGREDDRKRRLRDDVPHRTIELDDKPAPALTDAAMDADEEQVEKLVSNVPGLLYTGAWRKFDEQLDKEQDEDTKAIMAKEGKRRPSAAAQVRRQDRQDRPAT